MPDIGEQIGQIAAMIPDKQGTYCERKIFACKALMAQHDMGISAWCQHANISRQTWYSTQARPDFGDRCAVVARSIFGPHAIEIAAAMLKKARFGSADGMGDGMLQVKILQQVGAIDKDTKVDNALTVTIIERNAKIERGMQRLGLTTTPTPKRIEGNVDIADSAGDDDAEAVEVEAVVVGDADDDVEDHHE